MIRSIFLGLYSAIYRTIVRPLIFRTSTAEEAHERILQRLAIWDDNPRFQNLLQRLQRWLMPPQNINVGGVQLQQPAILAAGFVKGHGFEHEADALAAVECGENVMPGWRTMPNWVGAVEFGSFTRYPRLGNPSPVIWRDVKTGSTQNRIGLKNPGVRAASAFLAARPLPDIYGINIAPTPGLGDENAEADDIRQSLEILLASGLRPSWLTLNLSCPNTEDDPLGNQSEAKARLLCAVAQEHLQPVEIPLWVKISPNLSPAQYAALMKAFVDLDVAAVVATNTLGMPAPHDDTLTAGVGGGKLHQFAVDAVQALKNVGQHYNNAVDIVACGGVHNRQRYDAFAQHGVRVVQYWSALVYEGPFAPAIISR